jgi:hypothetical protein
MCWCAVSQLPDRDKDFARGCSFSLVILRCVQNLKVIRPTMCEARPKPHMRPICRMWCMRVGGEDEGKTQQGPNKGAATSNTQWR